MYKGSFQYQWKDQLQSKEHFYTVLKDYLSNKQMFQRLAEEDSSLNEILDNSEYILRLFKNNLHNEMKREWKGKAWYEEKIEAWNKNLKSKKHKIKNKKTQKEESVSNENDKEEIE